MRLKEIKAFETGDAAKPILRYLDFVTWSQFRHKKVLATTEFWRNSERFISTMLFKQIPESRWWLVQFVTCRFCITPCSVALSNAKQTSWSTVPRKWLSQKTFRLLWKPNVDYSIHNSPSLVTIRSQMNPAHVFPTYRFKIHFNIIFHLCTGISCVLFRSGFATTTLYAFLISSMRATCPATSSSLIWSP
jgi:hypothetical protein